LPCERFQSHVDPGREERVIAVPVPRTLTGNSV